MKRFGILLALMIAFTLSLPAQTALAKSQPNGTDQASGRGMNRQGSPGIHPGKGWKDPGQVQGSERNSADPDCTGNRTVNPQPTNTGACDDPNGAADKPGGTGGFDDDRDWNNGCGNDTDFEDDNNGRCGGKRVRASEPEKPGEPESSQGPQSHPNSPPTVVLSAVSVRPVQVLSEQIRAIQPLSIPRTLPATGIDPTMLVLNAVGLISIGSVLVKKAGRSKKRAGGFRLFSYAEA